MARVDEPRAFVRTRPRPPTRPSRRGPPRAEQLEALALLGSAIARVPNALDVTRTYVVVGVDPI